MPSQRIVKGNLLFVFTALFFLSLTSIHAEPPQEKKTSSPEAATSQNAVPTATLDSQASVTIQYIRGSISITPPGQSSFSCEALPCTMPDGSIMEEMPPGTKIEIVFGSVGLSIDGVLYDFDATTQQGPIIITSGGATTELDKGGIEKQNRTGGPDGQEDAGSIAPPGPTVPPTEVPSPS